MLQALESHARWNTLIPYVYGVSAQTFEAGWRRFLQAHYGLGEDASGPVPPDAASQISRPGPEPDVYPVRSNNFDRLVQEETQVTIGFGRCGHK